MNTREPYEFKQQSIKSSLKALCLLNGLDVQVEMFQEAIDEMKMTIDSMIRYTLFTFTEVSELYNFVANMIRDTKNSRLTLQVFLKNVLSDLDNVKVLLRHNMDKLYDA